MRKKNKFARLKSDREHSGFLNLATYVRLSFFETLLQIQAVFFISLSLYIF